LLGLVAKGAGGALAAIKTIPWKKSYGKWPAFYWAWLVALAFQEIKGVLSEVILDYKLLDCPSTDIHHLHDSVDEAYYDLSHQARHGNNSTFLLQPPLVETLSGHRTRANNVFF
jgi:hypothetical protein